MAFDDNGPKIPPFEFAREWWPHVYFYDKQREIIKSTCVERNRYTVVPAAHKVGKDFVTGFIVLYNFLAYQESRVITTSVKDDHLRVLWGEIGRYIDTAKHNLTVKPNDYQIGTGPLIVNHRDIRKRLHKQECKISYLRGMVSERGEGLAGHHARHTFLAVDEASGVDDEVINRCSSWMRACLIIGNPYDVPPTHFFRKFTDEGDVLL